MKRLTDIILCTAILLFFSPIFLIIIIAIRVSMGSPIFFMQTRAGKYGKPFNIIKFRTMSNIHDFNGRLLPDSQRITALGHLLRKTSFDEAPELLNILKGDMSFVGPRPLLMEYNDLYNSEQAKRLEVLPGLTGLAQVNGRNNLTWTEKFKLDIQYVENFSSWLDFKILIKTIFVLFQTKGTSHTGYATMPKFKGD